MAYGEKCECCWKRQGAWWDIADCEMFLCRPCAQQVAEEMGGKAKRIDMS